MNKIYLPLLLVSFFFNSCCSQVDIDIVDKPIIFDQQRKELTIEYKKNRYHLDEDHIEITPRMIVLHWTVIPTFEKTFAAFNPAQLPNWRPELENVSGLNVSSQFVVDRDGTIYRLMPETTMARHTIGLNYCAIGIENVGGTKELPLTEAQKESNIKLVSYLKEKYQTIDYLIGHYQYTNFEDHELWLEVNDGYRTKKNDPDEPFLETVKAATKHYNFKPTPLPKDED